MQVHPRNLRRKIFSSRLDARRRTRLLNRRRRLLAEPLESRHLLAVFSVVNTNDSGPGSLRMAIDQANTSGGADTITFASTIFNSAAPKIEIASQLPTITGGLTINEPSEGMLTIDAGGNNYRIFDINDGNLISLIDVRISGLILTGGSTAIGGAIKSTENLTITNSTIRGNNAEVGGGIESELGTLDVSGVTISGNTASLRGGGIANSGAASTANVTSSTISGNTATQGGGIDNGTGTLTVTSSTISGNTAANFGGGIQNFGNATLRNTIVAGNRRTIGDTQTDIDGNLQPSSSHNLIGTGGSGGLTTGTNDNQVFVDWTSVLQNDGTNPILDDNGGPTQTIALLRNSPAKDAGFSTEPTDQRGAPFQRDDGGGVDIGAYERQTLTDLNLVVDSIGDENNGDHGDGDLTLREAIGLANASAGPDVITFDASVFAFQRTINVGSQLPTINEELTITGPGPSLLSIDAGDGPDNVFGTGDGYRFFEIDAHDGDNFVDIQISGITLTGADSSGDGGAILNRENLMVTDSAIVGNAAISFDIDDDEDGDGGGIFSDGKLSVTRSRISDNVANRNGGGIYSRGDTLDVSEVTISGNGATVFGGGIFNTVDANVIRTTISDNRATIAGGGIRNFGTLNIVNSTITGNSAGVNGGGIDNQLAESLTVSSSTISGNIANTGAGIHNATSTATLTSTIVAGNRKFDFDITQNDIEGSTDVESASSHNLIGTGGSGGLTTGANNNLVFVDWTVVLENDGTAPILADNGGPTKTIALLATGPALNHGSSSETTDGRGFLFARDDGNGVDIGAFERQTLSSTSLVVDSTSDESDGDYSSGNLTLREAIELANRASVGADTITFDPALAKEFIGLTGGELAITEAVSIDGGGVSISGLGATQIFLVDDSDITKLQAVSLTNLNLSDGNGSGGEGGAIFNREDLTISRSSLFFNATTSFGGAVRNAGTLRIEHSTLSNNRANLSGGAIRNDGVLDIRSSTITGNRADAEGDGRYGSENGGGINTFIGSTAPVTLTNSIVAGNFRGAAGTPLEIAQVPDDINEKAIDLAMNNLVGDSATALGVTDGVDGNIVGVDVTDVLDAILADNGGPTLTHALVPGSPALNVGLSVETTDQRGLPFLRDDGNGVDIGAFESQGAAPQVSSIVIDDGTGQASVVRSITVNFDSDILFDAGAFDLRDDQDNPIDVTTSVAPGTLTNQVVLTFNGAGSQFGSLVDADYTLRVLDTKVLSAVGVFLDGDNSGGMGGDAVDSFYRLFGDANGDEFTDFTDFSQFFLPAFGSQLGVDTGYLAAMDFDNDGLVDFNDFANGFLPNFGKSR